MELPSLLNSIYEGLCKPFPQKLPSEELDNFERPETIAHDSPQPSYVGRKEWNQ